MVSIVILSLLGTLLLFLGFLNNRALLAGVTIASILAAVAGLYYEVINGPALSEWLYRSEFMNGMMQMDPYAILFSANMMVSALLLIPFAKSFASRTDAHPAEYFALMLFTLAGGIMMVSYMNLLMLFIGLEILSISVYILTGSDKRNPRSNEAALKYFLMGSFSTGILLFGVALWYGATGSFQLDFSMLSVTPEWRPMFYMGMILLLIGLLFKASAVPFHFWTPDVYEGAPTIFTAFMATVVKTAAFGAIMRILLPFAMMQNDFATKAIVVCVVATLLLGNILAVVQNSFKRMMAYSSIAHAGYMLIGIVSPSHFNSVQGILFYTLAYGIATAAAFGILIIISDQAKSEGFEAFKGLGKNDPVLALVLTIAMCSLAGIPLTGGFIGKLYLFSGAIQADYAWLVIVAVIGSAISIYYYFRVIVAMYMGERSADLVIQSTMGQKVALVVAATLTICLGLAPDLLKGAFPFQQMLGMP